MDDRDRLISECADSEDQLARDLAAVRQLQHLTLALLRQKGLQLDRQREQQRRLRDEYRRLRETHSNTLLRAGDRALRSVVVQRRCHRPVTILSVLCGLQSAGCCRAQRVTVEVHSNATQLGFQPVLTLEYFHPRTLEVLTIMNGVTEGFVFHHL